MLVKQIHEDLRLGGESVDEKSLVGDAYARKISSSVGNSLYRYQASVSDLLFSHGSHSEESSLVVSESFQTASLTILEEIST